MRDLAEMLYAPIAAIALVALCVCLVHVIRILAVKGQIRATYERAIGLGDFENGYLMKKDWDALLSSAAPIMPVLVKTPAIILRLVSLSKESQTILDCCRDSAYRETRNAEYKRRELQLCDKLFSDIDGGKSLDPQQRDAIVTDEYNNLVIAGAGSGKTSVVVGKVKYLVERWGVAPEDILVTSFTRASVEDLGKRIEDSGVVGVSTRTFHSLGRRILGSDYAIAPENGLERFVKGYLAKQLVGDEKQSAAFLEFFGLRALTRAKSPDFEESEIRMQLLQSQDMRTLKGLIEELAEQSENVTIFGERVRSVEELLIANFLFLNGITYVYEDPYPYEIPDALRDESRGAYKPDFHLTDYDIWLEHFGVNENGRVAWLATGVEEQKYLDDIIWKRKVHAACGTNLIESYSYWNKDHDLLNQVERLLLENGVVLNNDPARNAEACGRLMRDERFFSGMARLITTFISLVKSNNATTVQVDDKARGAYEGNGVMWHRYCCFTDFAWPILQAYQRHLNNGLKPQIDFDDMINRAAESVRQNGLHESYRYIIVDEYQDISLSRFGLLSAIRDATDARLMCVGDDWQAIYRFAGSDVTLFTHFGELVGYYEEMRIEHTYRNCQQLVDVASSFISKNPNQLRKTVISEVAQPYKVPILVASRPDMAEAFTVALESLLRLPNHGGDIKVLGRNRRDLEDIFPGYTPTDKVEFRNPKRGDSGEGKFEKVIIYKINGAPVKEIGFMTVHKSKGLQADNVIVIGLVNRRGGFPNTIEDDPVLELLLADSDDYENAEERRLFYVALTRTKNLVWLVAGDSLGRYGASPFVLELLEEGKNAVSYYSEEVVEEAPLCPKCGGKLMKRIGANNKEFVGCSNFPLCDTTYADVRILEDKKRCPDCGGWLTRRRRKDGTGEFFGCTNYPKYCYYTMNLDGTNGRSGRLPVGNDSRYGYAHVRVGGAEARANADALRRSDASLRCPVCKAPMVLRTGPYGDFYGCSNYPACKGTLSVRRWQ